MVGIFLLYHFLGEEGGEGFGGLGGDGGLGCCGGRLGFLPEFTSPLSVRN